MQTVAQSKAISLTVTARHGRPARTADAQQQRNSGDPGGPAIADIIAAEVNVPTSVSCVAHTIDPSGVRTELRRTVVENTIDTLVNHYSLGGRPRVTLNLNEAPPAQLLSLAGVGPTERDLVVAARSRPFRNRDDFIARLGGTLWHNMVSTAGIRVRAQ